MLGGWPMTRRRWIQDSETGELYEVGDNHCPQVSSGPFIQGDIQPYKSMVTGEIVTSRSRHRNLLKQHGLIEVGNETRYLKSKQPAPPPGLKDAVVKAVKKHRGF